jgi:hypothetical protein
VRDFALGVVEGLAIAAALIVLGPVVFVGTFLVQLVLHGSGR